MCYLDHIQSVEITRTLSKKMSAPLITLLSKEPEIQYVALRNMSLILQKRPTILQHEMKVFFCKYNDPIYVKMEKLEIIIMLANAKNIDQVLLEFKEYATAADIEFVRRAIRAIGRCAIKLESSAEKCIHVLLELIENGFNPVVQESIIVIKDIFRKYPNRYESIIGKLCQNLDTLDEPEAKAAMIWIIGEYAKKIENAGPLLKGFLENFLDEPVQVQLQLLTATVKLFLHRPKNSKSMLVNVLNLATKECDDPDLRDRGFIYWRLLSDGPQAAAGVVLTEKPQIDDDTSRFDPEILDDLVSEISNVAAVYHKPAETFIKFRRAGAHLKKKKQTASAQKESEPDDIPIETLTIDLEYVLLINLFYYYYLRFYINLLFFKTIEKHLYQLHQLIYWELENHNNQEHNLLHQVILQLIMYNNLHQIHHLIVKKKLKLNLYFNLKMVMVWLLQLVMLKQEVNYLWKFQLLIVHKLH